MTTSTIVRDGLVCSRDQDDQFICNIEQTHKHHSPTGMRWGYAGSGPADLALNVMAAFLPRARGERGVDLWDGSKVSEPAWNLHQRFKHAFIANMAIDGGTVPAQTIRDWLNAQPEMKDDDNERTVDP